MPSIREYHRPETIEAALALLARPDVESEIIGGGTVVTAADREVAVEVVDLQALGLNGVTAGNGSEVRIGATTRLQEIVESAAVPELVRDAAHREAPSTIRNAATIGGAVASGDPESGLVAALLVHEARLEVVGPAGSKDTALADLLAEPSLLAGAVITSVTVAGDGVTAWSGTGRTPADTPIVAAYARRSDGATRLALCGVAATPTIVDPAMVAALEPPADFRGSAEYRRSLAQTHADRVLALVEEAS